MTHPSGDICGSLCGTHTSHPESTIRKTRASHRPRGTFLGLSFAKEIRHSFNICRLIISFSRLLETVIDIIFDDLMFFGIGFRQLFGLALPYFMQKHFKKYKKPNHLKRILFWQIQESQILICFGTCVFQ